jgi:hypothetical protein
MLCVIFHMLCVTFHMLRVTFHMLVGLRKDTTGRVPDLQLLREERRQQLIDKRLIAANAKRFSFDYRVGDEVLKLAYKPSKLDPRAVGPFRVEQVHANGTCFNDTSQQRFIRAHITVQNQTSSTVRGFSPYFARFPSSVASPSASACRGSP